MYDVMIIDDDQPIRERLKSIIKWEEAGLRLVCEAEDSDTGRELFMLNRPKIIVTDINIPIITGLDLAEEISTIDPEVRFIVITGYNDFEYVRTSVKLGAIDLISKPIMPDEINASLKKATAYFDRIRNEQLSSKNMRLLLEENLPVLREKFISYLLNHTRNYNESEIIKKFKSLQLNIMGNYYSVVLIFPILGSLHSADSDRVLVTVRNTCEKLLIKAGYKVYSFYDNNYRLNCLLSCESRERSDRIEEVTQDIHESLKFYWNIEVFAGIGLPMENITKLHVTRHEAFIALNYQGVLECGPVINYKNVARLDTPDFPDKSEIIRQAVISLKNNDLDEMCRLIKNEITVLFSNNKNYLQQAKKIVFEFISSVIVEYTSLGIDIPSLAKYSDIYIKIFSSKNIQTLLQYMYDFTLGISSELVQKHCKSKNMLIKMAKDFIRDNLGNEDLNLDMVSYHIGLSRVYFCKLFHKEESQSFSEYLNTERVNKAKKILTESNMKVYEVSYATGYKNTKYFNYIFKRITGATPLEYRHSV